MIKAEKHKCTLHAHFHSLPLCVSKRFTKDTHAQTRALIQTRATKPWTDRVRFIAHLGRLINGSLSPPNPSHKQS